MSDHGIAITINGEKRVVEVSTSLQGVTDSLQLPNTGAAVAVNGAVVPKNGWSGFFLSDGDEVLVVQATQGG